MAARFIPNKDVDFKGMAHAFMTHIAQRREHYGVSEIDLELLTRAVTAFIDAFEVAKSNATCGPLATSRKEACRVAAVDVIRRIGAAIRANDRLSAADKLLVGVKVRSKKLKRREVSIYPPLLYFEGITGEGGEYSAIHRLRVEPGYDFNGEQDREGATRIELFVDLVGPGEPIPSYPGETAGGRPWYLGSFSPGTIHVSPPIPPVPMLVVYWVRWADSRHRVGPFSKTCQTRWEGMRRGAPQATLGPMPTVQQLELDPRQITVLTQFRERYIEAVRVEQRMLEDSRGEAKQLPDAA